MIYKVKPNTREKGIEAHLVKLVKERGGMCKKIGNEGWPDRLVVLPGVVPFFVETKSKTGKLSPLQAHVKGNLEARGCAVGPGRVQLGAEGPVRRQGHRDRGEHCMTSTLCPAHHTPRQKTRARCALHCHAAWCGGCWP